jgi:hypothetical protein
LDQEIAAVNNSLIKTYHMKLQIRILAITFCTSILLFSNCTEDEPTAGLSQNSLQGTWTVTVSEGTEWKQGVGVITPRADDPETLNATFVFNGNSFTATAEGGSSFGTFTFSVDDENSTIMVDDLGFFNVKDFVAGTSMKWEQREPLETDYEERDGGQFLYYQKFWSFEKE